MCLSSSNDGQAIILFKLNAPLIRDTVMFIECISTTYKISERSEHAKVLKRSSYRYFSSSKDGQAIISSELDAPLICLEFVFIEYISSTYSIFRTIRARQGIQKVVLQALLLIKTGPQA